MLQLLVWCLAGLLQGEQVCLRPFYLLPRVSSSCWVAFQASICLRAIALPDSILFCPVWLQYLGGLLVPEEEMKRGEEKRDWEEGKEVRMYYMRGKKIYLIKKDLWG